MSNELSTGDVAPAVDLTAHDGSTVTIGGMHDQDSVVYFFPKAFTPGCTTEACDFRDNLSSLPAKVYGVSGDSPEELARFVEEYDLAFTLLSDPDHAAAKQWGAWGERTINGETSEGPLRSTFVIDAASTVARAEYNVNAEGHVAQLASELNSQ